MSALANSMKDLKPPKYCGQQWLGRPIQLLTSIYIRKNSRFFSNYFKIEEGRRRRRGNEGEKRREIEGNNLEL